MNKFRERFAFLSVVRFSLREQTLFAKRLSFLVKAGVPVLESLEMLRRQSKSGGTVRMYERLIADVSGGQFLSTGMARFKNVFGEFAINLIKIGETGGILSQNLSYLAEELKKKHLLKRKVVGALVYPIIVTVATVGLVVVLTAYIFPKILPIFSGLKVTLPWSTRALMFVSTILRDHGLLILLALVVFFVGLVLTVKLSKHVRAVLDRVLLRLPIAGNIAKDYNLANICRTLGLLLRSHTRVVEAIGITALTSGNQSYRRVLERVAKGVSSGSKISRFLENEKRLFPEMMVHMVAVGETTGNLPETLLYLADMYEHDLDEATRNLSNSIEPALMVIMGLVVGFVAVSIITPIYQVTQNLGR